MKNLKFFLSFLLLTAFSKISAQVTIQVLDKKEQFPIANAYIKIDSIENITNDSGIVSMALAAGKHKVFVKMIGYDIYYQIIDFNNQPTIINLNPNINILNTITVTSGKYDKPLGEVTVSLDILKASTIESVNTTTGDKILDKIPGVQVIDGQANIRGGSGFSYGAGSRVAILIDDISAIQVDGGTVNWRDIPIENMEQIEVLKGAASSLFGSAAMNGIINFRTGYATSEPITKLAVFGTGYLTPNDISKKWWSKLPYEGGFNFLHKQKIDKLDLVGSVFYLNNDTYNKDTYEKYGRATLNLRYRLLDNLQFGVNLNYNNGNNSYFFYWKDAEKGAFQGASSAYTINNKVRYMIDPYISYTDKYHNNHKILSRFYNITNDLNANRSNKSITSYIEYQFQHTFKSNLILKAGILRSSSNVDAQLFGNNTYKAVNQGIYAQLDKKIGNRFNLSVGARYENNSISNPDSVYIDGFIKKEWIVSTSNKSSESKPVFRIGANYQMAKATFIRASWGQAYRFPTIAEKFITTSIGFPIVPNPDLTSETGWTAELGIKQGFKINEFLGYIDASIFQSNYDNMMEFVLSRKYFAFQSQNIGNTSIKGLELSVAGQGNIGNTKISTIIGYTYIDPRYQILPEFDSAYTTSKENILKYRFRNMFKADVQFDYKKISIGVAAQANSKMEAIDGVFVLLIPGLREYRANNDHGFEYFDIRMAYQWNSHFKTTCILSNIFNTEYSLRPGLLEAPRNVTVRLDYKF